MEKEKGERGAGGEREGGRERCRVCRFWERVQGLGFRREGGREGRRDGRKEREREAGKASERESECLAVERERGGTCGLSQDGFRF